MKLQSLVFTIAITFSLSGLAAGYTLEELQKMDSLSRELRELRQSDPHRPIYHFTSPSGIKNAFDPNGALYWKGQYHLSFLYTVPRNESKEYGHTGVKRETKVVWGHAVSTDLLHWTLYPDMLASNEDIDYFSGGAFISKEGVPHIVYHAPHKAANFIAYSADEDLKEWVRLEGGVVTDTEPDDQWVLAGYRCCIPPKGDYGAFDPDAWYDKDSDNYYQISGGIKPGLFKSKNLSNWEYLGPPVSEESRMNYRYEDMSCPDFFSIGDKSMILFISHSLGAQYYIGEFSDDKFVPEQHGRMMWPGGSLFAPEQLKDDKGRNIMWAWVADWYRPTFLPNYGWSGIMSLPRIVSLGSDGTLEINPAQELNSIRQDEIHEKDIFLAPNQEQFLRSKGKSLELKLEINGGDTSPFGVKVFASPDGREQTAIRYEPQSKQLVIDFSKSNVRGPVSVPAFNPEGYDWSKTLVEQWKPNENTLYVSEQRAPLELRQGETLKLDIFIDRSVIEVFANGRQVITQLVYPELENSTGLSIFSGGEKVSFKNIQSWQMSETNAY